MLHTAVLKYLWEDAGQMMSFQLMGLCKQPRWSHKAGEENLLVYSSDQRVSPMAGVCRMVGKQQQFSASVFHPGDPSVSCTLYSRRQSTGRESSLSGRALENVQNALTKCNTTRTSFPLSAPNLNGLKFLIKGLYLRGE